MKAPIPPPTPEPKAPALQTVRPRSPVAKIGRMLLLIGLWCGIALFGSLAFSCLIIGYGVATGFPAPGGPLYWVVRATSNALAAGLCFFFVRKICKKRDI